MIIIITNPEIVKSIEEDCEKLGLKPDQVVEKAFLTLKELQKRYGEAG